MAAYVGFRTVAERSETRLVDAHLQSGLRSVLAAYRQELDSAAGAAEALARDPRLQAALREEDAGRLEQLLRASPNLRVETPSGLSAGRTPPLAAEREVSVQAPDGAGELGVVVASLPLDGRLVRQLHERSGLDGAEHVLVLRGDRILLGSGDFTGTLQAPREQTATVRVGDTPYRVLAASAAAGADAITLAVLSPQARIDAATASSERRLLLVLVTILLLVGLLAYLQGRSIVRTVQEVVEGAKAIALGRLGGRVPVRGRDELALLASSFNEMAAQLQARLAELEDERRRLREATLRFGEALASTNDVDQLLRLIVETAVESTGAEGGLLVSRGREAFHAGEPDAEGDRVELPLRVGQEEYGSLVLVGPEFALRDVETAALLVGHAAVALENARLHGIVERQALADSLTGLANRRHAEDALATELSRAGRYGGPLSVVLADLDNFKAVNDLHGHAAGDSVLRELADVLRESLRDVDVAARWGGEEFALILPGTDTLGAVEVAERVRRSLEERVIVTPEGATVGVTASFGVATHVAETPQDELLAAADAALYEAKRAGKNRIAVAPAAAPSA